MKKNIWDKAERNSEKIWKNTQESSEKSKKHSHGYKRQDKHICRQSNQRKIAHFIQNERQNENIYSAGYGNYISQFKSGRDPQEIFFNFGSEEDESDSGDKGKLKRNVESKDKRIK